MATAYKDFGIYTLVENWHFWEIILIGDGRDFVHRLWHGKEDNGYRLVRTEPPEGQHHHLAIIRAP